MSSDRPETKYQLKMWIGHNERAMKKAKMVPLTGKVMSTIFWDSNDKILIDNTPTHSSIIATAKLIEIRYKLLNRPPYFERHKKA